MSTVLFWFIFIGFTIFAYYRFNWAVLFYLAIKVVLIKSMLLFYVDGLPLITLDRAMEFVLLCFLFSPIRTVWIKIKSLKDDVFFWPWILILAAQLLLFLAHSNEIMNAVKGLLLFIFEYTLLYVLIVLALKEQKDLKQLIRYFGIVFLLVGLYGLLEKWTGENPFIDFFSQKAQEIGNDSLVFTYGEEIRFGISGRIQSVVFHAISYGGILALFIPVFINQFLSSKSSSAKLLWYVLVCILATNLVFSNSRAAVLSCAIIGLSSLYLLFRGKQRLQNTVLFVIPLVVIMLALVSNPHTKEHLYEAFYGWSLAGELKGSTVDDRAGKFEYALDVISSDIVFGKGFGHVAQLIDAKNQGIGGAESFWLRQLVEAGLVGIVGYFAFFVGIVFVALNQLVKKWNFEFLFIILLSVGYVTFISLTGELNTFPFFILLLAVYSNLAASHKIEHE